MEVGLAGYNDLGMLNGNCISPMLITSCNKSHKGTITQWEKAKAFGTENGVHLVIKCNHMLRATTSQGQIGSYPCERLRQDRVGVFRRGVGHDEIKNKYSAKALRAGLAKQVRNAPNFLLLTFTKCSNPLTKMMAMEVSIAMNCGSFVTTWKRQKTVKVETS